MTSRDLPMSITGPLDREHLARLLGMLGSDHDGEVLNAARAAEKLRRESKATWHDIVNPPARHQQQQERDTVEERLRDPALLAESLDFVRDNLRLLSDWEQRFVASISAWRGSLTRKQLLVLARIVHSVADEVI